MIATSSAADFLTDRERGVFALRFDRPDGAPPDFFRQEVVVAARALIGRREQGAA